MEAVDDHVVIQRRVKDFFKAGQRGVGALELVVVAQHVEQLRAGAEIRLADVDVDLSLFVKTLVGHVAGKADRVKLLVAGVRRFGQLISLVDELRQTNALRLAVVRLIIHLNVHVAGYGKAQHRLEIVGRGGQLTGRGKGIDRHGNKGHQGRQNFCEKNTECCGHKDTS